ncbi:MAG TPA: hypothetical protein VEL28_00405 [Candidatus Binatia bacterium]|nr:hypothetical protein [Candidatus Binatia bacterium]
MSRGWRRAGLGRLALAVAGFAAVFTLHSRFVLTHFSRDGYLLDSGWFAWLLQSGDPWLHNPRSINELSYYAHHLSPYLFLLGTPLMLLGLSGIESFAFHQGLTFGLFFLAVVALLPSAAATRDRIVAGICAVSIGALADVLLQAAAYPHFEIALIAAAALMLAAIERGRWAASVACVIVLVLIREDGGLYAAAMSIAAIFLAGIRPHQDERARSGVGLHPAKRARSLAVVAAMSMAFTIVAVLAKALLFPGYATFGSNFSGDSWKHLSGDLLVERLQALVLNPNVAPALIGSLILAAFDLRYAVGIVIFSPLFALHLIAVREELGLFRLYYALPWLLACVVALAVFARRAAASSAHAVEAGIMLVMSVALTAPMLSTLGLHSSWRVAEAAATRPVADLRAMQRFIADTADAAGAACASTGIAALRPDDFLPAQVLAPRSPLESCEVVLLLRGDMHYRPLRTRLESDGFERRGARGNAEAWQRTGAPERGIRSSRGIGA